MVSMRFFSATHMQKTNYYKKAIAHFPLNDVYVGRLYDTAMRRKLHRFKFAHNTTDSTYFTAIFRQLVAESALQNEESMIVVYPPISFKDRIFR